MFSKLYKTITLKTRKGKFDLEEIFFRRILIKEKKYFHRKIQDNKSDIFAFFLMCHKTFMNFTL